MDLVKINIQLFKKEAKMPQKQTSGSAGYDLYAALESKVIIDPGQTVLIPLGFKTSFSEDYVALIFARSGTAIKHGCAPANKVGVIESDYRGEWIVALHNHGKESFAEEPGDRIAQVLFIRKLSAAFVTTGELDDTERGEGGFNSTGVK